MGKLSNNLASELQTIFGGSFGESREQTSSLEESVSEFLEARKNDMGIPLKSPGKMMGRPFSPKIKDQAKKADIKHSAPVGKKKPARSGNTPGSKRHNPFKRASNLGTGPGTPPGFKGRGPRHHDQAKCWNCKCGNIYSQGCECIGTGATKDCPKGHEKHVGIDKAYRKAYNKEYHKWRGEKRASGDGVTKRLASRSARK